MIALRGTAVIKTTKKKAVFELLVENIFSIIRLSNYDNSHLTGRFHGA